MNLSFESLSRVHIIGICGTLMGNFAAFLKRRGIAVTGSDQNVYPPMSDVLSQAGVKLFSGYSAANITSLHPRPELIVIGNVISASNVEAQAAIASGIPYSSLPEAMERLLLPGTRNIVVAGTHGKTTTSCMAAHVLTQAGRDPSYFFGGVAYDLLHSFHVTRLDGGAPFVLEGDEYDTAYWDKVPKFNHYLPDDVILTSVEYDHADIYPNLDSLVRAFEGLIDRIRSGGRLFACADYEWVRHMMKRASGRPGVEVVAYGSPNSKHARYTPGQVSPIPGEGVRFTVLDDCRAVDELEIALPGVHNVTNALSVYLECVRLGLSSESIRSGLKSFRGVKRRQEVRGEVNGILVIDDFAHHPTAVRETLRALRLKYPKRRLLAIYEPRSATSRRKIFQKEFARAFAEESDLVLIATPFDQSKIPQDEQFSTEQLVADIGSKAIQFREVPEGVEAVRSRAQSGDLVVVMSNGGFGGFVDLLLRALN